MIDYGLKDRVVIITGTNNPEGIGATTAFTFAEQGAKIVLVYKRILHPYDETKVDSNGLDRYFKANSQDASLVEKRLVDLGADYLTIESDITDEDCVIDIYEQTINRFGKVDVLINNAAVSDEDGNDVIEKMSQMVIDNTFAVNVRGTLLMTREFIKHHGDYGRIVNLSTDAAQAFGGQITYGASKAAIEAFTRSIAIDVGKYGITVNCVSPGPTQTGYIDKELEEHCLPQIPLGKLVQPQDIANTILFLASNRATMLTGQVIKVSGGHAL